MKEAFIVRWPRRYSGACCLIGTALLCVIIDVHFFGYIPACVDMKDSIIGTSFLGSIGLLFSVMGGYLFLRPPILIEAGLSGIRINLRGKDESFCIPWSMILKVSRGKMRWIGSNDCGATPEDADALLIACDPSIRLDVKQWGDDHVMNGFNNKVVLNAKYLPGSLKDAVNRLREMKQLYS